jgi:hypothetical protein
MTRARALLGEVTERFSDTAWAPRALAARALLETRERLKGADSSIGTVPAAFLSYRQLTERYPTAPDAEIAVWQVGEAARAFVDLATHFPQTRYDAWWRAAELYDRRLKDRESARAAYARVPPSSRNYKDAQKKARR